MATTLRDLLFAARTLRKHPTFSIIAMGTVALGIGACTAIFSVVQAVLLRPLPYADPGRLVTVWQDMRNRNVVDFPFPPGDFHDLREQGTLFEGFAGVTTGRGSITGTEGPPEQVRNATITPNAFRLLGVPVVLGRDFTDADGTPLPPPPPAAPGAAPVAAPANLPPPPPGIAILSHEFWQRRFGGDRGVVGRMIEVNGGPRLVVGVLGPGFELLFPPGTNVEPTPDIFTAMRVDFETGSRVNVFLRIVGRLKPGVTLAQARSQVDALATELRKRFPIKETAGVYIRLEPMRDDLVADVRPSILALMGAVLFVLLIACANVANLLLVRASARERELAVRAALGGSRWRLVRQMLTESLVIAAGGAALGLLLAQYSVDLLIALGPRNLPRLRHVGLDPTVLGFTALAALVSAVVFGVLPALRASRADVMETLRTSGRSGGLAGGRRLREAVVIVEVALAFVLLIGAGLMVRSFVALHRSSPGYDPQNVLTFSVQLFGPRYAEPEARATFQRQLRDRLSALPGVQAVSAATPLPLDGGTSSLRWGTEAALTDPTAFQQATAHFVLPGYFEAMRAPLLDGRTFTEEDNAQGPRRVVVDRVLAEKAFPGKRAVGQRILTRINTDQPEWFEIIGVVAHQRHATFARDGREAIFFADGLVGHGAAGRWLVRTAGDPAALSAAVRAQVAEVDARLVIAEVQPMGEFVARATAQTRFALTLISLFAAVAAVLAAVGLYGVLSSAVRQRTMEIGVRMAFGAPRAGVFQLVIGQGLLLSVVGVVLGALAAVVVTRAIASLLVGVTPTDPATFVGTAALFVGVSSLACWLPARRAAGLDPMEALREN
jgi:putative ABC transport system permease protein